MKTIATLIALTMISISAANAGVTIRDVTSKTLFDRVADAEEYGENYHGLNKDNSENCKTPRHLWGCKYLKTGVVLPMVHNGRNLYNASKRGKFIEELAHQNGVTVEEFKDYMLQNTNNPDVPPQAFVKKEIELLQKAIDYFIKLEAVGFTAAQITVLMSLDDRFNDITVEVADANVRFSHGDTVNIELERQIKQ